MAIRVGIGIITCNRKDVLAETLARVRAHTTAPFTLAVADDGSTDGTADMVRSQNITLVTGRNMGIAWNKNRALFLLSALDAVRCGHPAGGRFVPHRGRLGAGLGAGGPELGARQSRGRMVQRQLPVRRRNCGRSDPQHECQRSVQRLLAHGAAVRAAISTRVSAATVRSMSSIPDGCCGSATAAATRKSRARSARSTSC